MSTSRPCKKEGTRGSLHVYGGVGCREGDRDQPAGRHEPQEASTSTLPFQNESNLSSIEIEPCPLGLSSATRLYIGRAPNRVKSTMKRGDGRERTCGKGRNARDVAEGREVVPPPSGKPPATRSVARFGPSLASGPGTSSTISASNQRLRRPVWAFVGASDLGLRPPETQRQQQGRVRQDPPSGTRLTSFWRLRS